MNWLETLTRMNKYSLFTGFASYVLLCIIAALSIIYIVKRKQKVSLIDQIPGPKTRFIFGNALEVNVPPKELLFRLISFCDLNKSGQIVRVWIASTPYVIIYKAGGAEVILRSQKFIDKSYDYNFLHPWLGTGLLTSTGSKWHSRRKMLTPAFHFKVLENFVHIFNQQSSILVNKLSHKADGKPFNIFHSITLCTLDIILESSMGRSINAQNNPESKYITAIDKILALVQLRQSRPWLQPDSLFNILGYGVQHNECLKVLHDFSNETIRQRKKEFAYHKNIKKEEQTNDEDDFVFVGKNKRLSFLDLLLEYSDSGSFLSDEDIREEVDTFMFEGHDTISAAINWSIYLLGSHPEIQQKLHEELDSIFGSSDRPVTSADLRELKFLECCIKEALRIFPSVPFLGRELSEDVDIDGHKVPAGTSIMIITYKLHRDENEFPDPEAFKPERFYPENSAKRHPYAYIPFSAGPRNCIGQKFAIMEAKVVLASLFRKFRMESTVKRENLNILAELVLKPENGTIVKLFSRT